MESNSDQRLIRIIKQQNWLMEALAVARSLQLPDWYIAAGAVRNTVWNYLHGFPTTSHQNDVDVIYFDKSDMDGDKERKSERILRSKYPKLKWEVVNQARSHLFEQSRSITRPPVNSSCESIAYWSETATCIGARLEDNGSLTICAPHGLDDLMDLIIKPIPRPYQDLSLYKRRVGNKGWDKSWPKLSFTKIKSYSI